MHVRLLLDGTMAKCVDAKIREPRWNQRTRIIGEFANFVYIFLKNKIIWRTRYSDELSLVAPPLAPTYIINFV